MNNTNTTNTAQTGIYTVDHPYTIKGEPGTYQTQNQMIRISLGGIEREIEISRLSEQHCWHTVNAVTCKYRTGNKYHRMTVQVVERNGTWQWVYLNRHGKHGVRPIAWADVVIPNARW